MAAVDIELKKAFGELQQKMIETSQKLRLSDIQIESFKRSIARSQLTDQELSALPAETHMYESVGRMFVLKDAKNIRNNIENRVHELEEKIKTLETNKSYLERNLKDSENNLREMIQHKKEAS
nr:EOG090X0LK7 [Triops cancriformis]